MDCMTDIERQIYDVIDRERNRKNFDKRIFEEQLIAEINKYPLDKPRYITRNYLYITDENGNCTEEENINRQTVLSENEIIRRCKIGDSDVPLVKQIVLMKCKSGLMTEILNQIISRGVEIDGVSYIFYTSSTNQMKNSEITLLEESFWNTNKMFLMCGLTEETINAKGGINMGKYLAAKALNMSNSVIYDSGISIDDVIVVKDFKMMVTSMVNYLDIDTLEISEQEMSILIEHMDGAGMFIPGIFPCSCQIRGGWLKGAIFPFDFHAFLNLHQDKVTEIHMEDAWDKRLNIDDFLKAKLILTDSQLKMRKYYKSMDEYRQKFKESEMSITVNNWAHAPGKSAEVRVAYQPFQTIPRQNMTEEAIERLSEKTIRYINEAKTKPNVALKLMGVDIESYENMELDGTTDEELIKDVTPLKMDTLSASIMRCPELLNDVHVRKVMQSALVSERNKAMGSKLILDGMWSYVCPDLYAFCQWLFLGRDNPEGLIKRGKVYNNFYKDTDIEEACCIRYPHLSDCEHGIRNLEKSDECAKWFIYSFLRTTLALFRSFGGSRKFDAAVDFLVPDSVDHEDTDAIQSYMESVNRYLTFDKDGNANGMDISRFCQDAVDNGLMVLDEAGENYQIAGQTTMEDFADGMGLALPFVQALFDKMQLKGGKFDWADEALSSFGDGILACEQSAAELEAEIDSLTQQRDSGIEIDGSKLDELQQKLDEVNQKKHELEEQSTANIEANIEIDQQIEDARSEVDGWKASLEADPTNLEIQANVENAEANLQELENQKQELQTPTTVEIQASLQSVTSEISSVKQQIDNFSDKEYTAKFNISGEDAAAKVQELQGQLTTLEGQKKSLEVYAETSGAQSEIDAVNNKKAEDKRFSISAIDNATGTINAINNMVISDKSFTITENHVVTKSEASTSKSGGDHLNGTAHAYGTAMADGSWSAKEGGTALVGELGREIVVDPHSGHWHTVGDNGAEFTNIPRGAIVFNHLQTEALLERGWVNGRGTALASGTAMVTGGIPVANANRKNSNQHSYSGNSSNSSSTSANTSANTSATNNNTEATNENTKSNKSLQDWIAQLIDVQKAENGRLADAIEDFEMHANQNKAIDTYVADSESYMGTLRQAQNRYMTKANALGVPGNYVHKIWAGELDIEDIQDEDLKEKISQYQTWYEKAKDLGDEIVDINRKIRETKIKKLDNIKDDYDNLVSLSSSMAHYNESVSDLSEKLNLVGNSSSLKKSMDMQAAMRQALVNEERQLTSQLNALVADGTIAKNTDTWNKWQEEIYKVKNSIVDCDSALADLKESIMEIRYSKFEKSLDNLDFTGDMASSVRDLMNTEGIFDDDVQLTSSGYAQLALMSTELVAAKQKTVNYQAAIDALKKDLKNGNITQAQYNEKLQEYQKGQIDAAKSTKAAKDAILDLVKNGIDKQTEATEKLISKRNEDLQKMKESNDYQKNMADKSKEINAVKAQIAALEGNDSKEAIAQKKNLNSKLQKLQDDYDEARKDHEYDVISDGYDSQLEKFKENQEAIKKELESSTEAQQKAISEVLEATKNQQSVVYNELKNIAAEYQVSLTTSLTDPWKKAESALKQFQDSMGKLNANVSIDTSKITNKKPTTSQTTPTKNESNKQNVDKSKTGTWLKQDGRWWYQHSDGSYTKDGWESIDGQWYKFDREGWMQTGWQAWGVDKNGQALWYYMTDSGNMATSTWIDDKYYVDHTGAMARNGYVKSKNSNMYYWVNGDGVWEPQWNTQNPDLKKHKLYYESGTPKAKDELAFMDDIDHRLNLGSEVMITDKGVLGNFGGSAIFNEKQTKFLHEFSKIELGNTNRPQINNIPQPSLYTPKLNTDFINEAVEKFKGGDTFNVSYDNMINIEGNVTKDVFPGMKKVCEESFQYTTRKLKDISHDLR